MPTLTSGTFPLQTGYLAYRWELAPATSTGQFSFSFYNEALSPSARLSLSGVSGKIFDNDGNYLHSYQANQTFAISGNIFSGHHNIFIEGEPKNLNVSRLTGYLSGFFLDTGVLNYAALDIRV